MLVCGWRLSSNDAAASCLSEAHVVVYLDGHLGCLRNVSLAATIGSLPIPVGVSLGSWSKITMGR